MFGGGNQGFGGNFGGNFGGHGHGHHGHHNNHHNQGQGQGFNQGQGFSYQGQGFSNHNQGFSNQGFDQSWHPTQGALYKIESGLGHNMVLDVSTNPNDKNNLIIYQHNGNSPNQKFYFNSIGGNKYGIFSAHNNQTIEVQQGGHNNGTRIVSGQPHKQSN